MKFYKNIFTIISIFILAFQTQASEKGIISGIVIEAKSSEKLPGVNIQIEGTLLGASTDINGSFIVYNVPSGSYTVHASMIGHLSAYIKNVQVTPNRETKIEIVLEETVINFDPLIVSANKMQKHLDTTPNSVSLIMAPEIERRYAFRVDQVLETVPGVNFIRDQVNIRGSTGFTIGAANRTLLLVDGVPVMASDTGEFNWDLLPVLDIEKIEVVKGAGSSLWGTAALGGVINIITKSPSEQGKILVRMMAGQYGEVRYDDWKWTNEPLRFGRVDVSYSKRFGPLGVRLALGGHESDGFSEVGDFKRLNFTGKFIYNFKNGSTWTFYSSYNQRTESIFVGWDDPQHPFQVAPSNRNSGGKMNMMNIYSKYNWILSPKAALKFRVSYLMTLMGNQFIQTADFNPARGLGAEIQGDFLPLSNLDLTYGCEFKWDTGSTKYFGDHKGYSIGLYGQAEYRLRDNIRFTPGLRYDRYQLIGGISQSLLSPRMGINIRPFTSTVFRASAGSGFRAATIAERYLNFENSSVIVEANPDLKAETSWSFDVGIRQYILKNWYFEIGAFRNDFDHLIEIDLKQSQIEFAKDIRVSVRFQNLLKAQIKGIELTTGGHWWRDRLRLNATATIIDHEDLVTHKPLTYRPKLIAHINPSLCLGPWEFHADYQYASRIEAVKLYYYDDRVPQKIWNFRLIYHLTNLDFQIALNNALDYYYTQIERSMGEIRNFTIGVTGEF